PSPPGRKHRPPDRGPADLDQFEAPLGKRSHLIRLSKAPSLPCPLFPPRRFEIGQPTARLDTGNQEEVYRAGSVGARESHGLNRDFRYRPRSLSSRAAGRTRVASRLLWELNGTLPVSTATLLSAR